MVRQWKVKLFLCPKSDQREGVGGVVMEWSGGRCGEGKILGEGVWCLVGKGVSSARIDWCEV